MQIAMHMLRIISLAAALLVPSLHANAQTGAAPKSTAAASPGPASETLGRLFLTPQQRQELDRRRQLNIAEAVTTNEGSSTANGQVTTSNGRTTTWINETPQFEPRRARDPSRVAIRAREGEPSLSLRIGETLDHAKGEVTDGLGGGQVRIERRQKNAR